ncbi:hypothetical protein MA16_Dca000313 [Dendrobium catenatum]|uniref:Uncharacterized protein n=1 Tax=Dendrobium catenatum TaxID=906689 RepID=A0A2I0WTI2_9ASPA|nr:hypothetical protein MA16_Dca000313 [Dendrobium catenatum]
MSGQRGSVSKNRAFTGGRSVTRYVGNITDAIGAGIKSLSLNKPAQDPSFYRRIYRRMGTPECFHRILRRQMRRKVSIAIFRNIPPLPAPFVPVQNFSPENLTATLKATGVEEDGAIVSAYESPKEGEGGVPSREEPGIKAEAEAKPKLNGFKNQI